MPAGQLSTHGDVPARVITAFLGTACGKAMYAARRATRPALNSSGTATVQAVVQSLQPVHFDQSTKVEFSFTVAWNAPPPSRWIPMTSLYSLVVMLGWLIVDDIFGPEMQLAQSSVGKTLLSKIIRPPTLASFSTSRTL